MAVVAVVGWVLGLAGWLRPSVDGVGTHEALGVGPCIYWASTGRPCPTCGMTTAFSWMVRGRVVRAFGAQPAGAVLCLTVMGLGVVALVTVLTGRLWGVDWVRVTPGRVGWAVLLLVLGGWGYKVWLMG